MFLAGDGEKLLLVNSTNIFLIGIAITIIGLVGGLVLRNNLIIVLLSFEMVLVTLNFLFLLYSMLLDDILGQLFSVLILGVAAAETSVGLAFLILYYRFYKVVFLDDLNKLKG